MMLTLEEIFGRTNKQIAESLLKQIEENKDDFLSRFGQAFYERVISKLTRELDSDFVDPAISNS